jgi:hypothetical protein
MLTASGGRSCLTSITPFPIPHTLLFTLLFISRESIFISLRIQALAGGDKPRRYFLRQRFHFIPIAAWAMRLFFSHFPNLPSSHLLFFRLPHSNFPLPISQPPMLKTEFLPFD